MKNQYPISLIHSVVRSFIQIAFKQGLPVLLVFFFFLAGQQQGAHAEGTTQTVSGIVFHDRSHSGVFEPGVDEALPGVAVSNGRDVVVTDAEGRYTLEVSDHTILFVVKPANWMVPVDALQIPRFYHIHNPEGASGTTYAGLEPTGPLPSAVNFPLIPSDEPEDFDVLVFADTQPRNKKEISYLARDAVAGLIGSEAAFGVTLGDIVFDDLGLFRHINETIATIGIPWRHVIGNHDLDFSADDNMGARGAYYNHYGPSYYSFSYGPAHFLVLDNNKFIIDGDNRYYRPQLDDDQLVFVQNELARIDKEKPLVVLMHIPWDDRGWNMEQRDTLMALLAAHPNAISLGAHWHRHYHRYLDEEYGLPEGEYHHMVSVGAVCGAWWRGMPDEYGIPHAMMSDGTPAGYGILQLRGDDVKMHWQSSRRPENFQMHVHVNAQHSDDETDHLLVTANIFNALPDARVQMRIGNDGQWLDMERIAERDPLRLETADLDALVENLLGEDLPWLEMGGTAHTYTLWQGSANMPLEKGTHVVHVRSEDKWWTHEDFAIIHVGE